MDVLETVVHHGPLPRLVEVNWPRLLAGALGFGVLGGVTTAWLLLAAGSSVGMSRLTWVTGVVLPGVLVLGTGWWLSPAGRAGESGGVVGALRWGLSPARTVPFALVSALVSMLVESWSEIGWSDFGIETAMQWVWFGGFLGLWGAGFGLLTSGVSAAIAVGVLLPRRGRMSLAGAHVLVAWVAGLMTFAAALLVSAMLGEASLVSCPVAIAVAGSVFTTHRCLS
ncbi:hypothetical protein [Kineosporia succinea]|uniref:Uncharacterized protein n=1 Tax=Kineosporia succinea TaxID=84632 RepID=A0ABT9PB74_9ACTN|nr:hypothetical protein [Kineosporia succinea]MDP9829944.1 hypothetical protein [Kineosporia succinea]